MINDWLNYAVLAVTLIIWAGLFIVVFKLDRRVKKLERN